MASSKDYLQFVLEQLSELCLNLYGLALCGGYANIRQERTNVSPESFRRWCSRCRKSHRFGPLPACPG